MPNQSYLDLEDELEDGKAPYSSISNRDPLEDVSSPLPTPVPASGPNSIVKNFIAQKMGTPSIEQDPLMQQYNKEQSELDSYRQAKLGADNAVNVGSALSQISQGSNAPRESQVYRNISQQNQELLGSKEKDLDRRRKVMESIEARKSREDLAKARKEDHALQQKELNERAKARADVANQQKDRQLDLRLDNLMSNIGNKIEHDEIIGKSQVNLASLEKARAILNNKDLPLTSQTLSDAEQDIANALSLRGQGATEGKIKRTEMESLGRKLAEIKQRIGNKPVDLRKEAPEIVTQIQKLNNALHDDYVDTINTRRNKVVDNYSSLVGNEEGKKRLDAYKKINMLEKLPSEEQKASEATNASGKYTPGQLIKYKGKAYRVAADGDTLEEVM
jgi:hypothetical protein